MYEDFGCGPPIFVIPQHTGDSVLLLPAPPKLEGADPAAGGLDVYFQGGIADAFLALPGGHAAWKVLLGHHEDCDVALRSLVLLQQRVSCRE